MTWLPVPTTVGVYVTLIKQLALVPTPISVHVPENVPVLVLPNVTLPVGAVAFTLVSVTVAVQLVALFATTVLG